jgi:protein disulfide-isomerase A6
MQLISPLYLILFFSYCIALPYGKDSGVIELTKSNFAETVFGSEHVWLVEFYAPWCGHCKRLAPEWEKLAKSMKGIVKVAAVNGDAEKELAGHYQIQGFPTIKVFPSQVQKAPKGEGFIKVPEDYNGPRTASAMANFAISKMPNYVTKVTSKNIDEFVGSADIGKALLFTNKKETTSLYKALAIDYHNRLNLGEVRDTEEDIVSKYGVTNFLLYWLSLPQEEMQSLTVESSSTNSCFNFLNHMQRNYSDLENQVHPLRKRHLLQSQFDQLQTR